MPERTRSARSSSAGLEETELNPGKRRCMSVEIDHVFVCRSAGAPEADFLIKHGLLEGSGNSHPGPGTANRRFFFSNAYLELLWVANATLDDDGSSDGRRNNGVLAAWAAGSKASRTRKNTVTWRTVKWCREPERGAARTRRSPETCSNANKRKVHCKMALRRRCVRDDGTAVNGRRGW